MAEVMPQVVQGEVIQSSQKIYPVPGGVRGNAAARRQYQAARRRGDGKSHKVQVHWAVIVGIALIIIVLIVLLAVLLPRKSSGKSSDDSEQGGHNAPGYCTASTSAEINQCSASSHEAS